MSEQDDQDEQEVKTRRQKMREELRELASRDPSGALSRARSTVVPGKSDPCISDHDWKQTFEPLREQREQARRELDEDGKKRAEAEIGRRLRSYLNLPAFRG